ncbi:unnamed protein product [Schistosoma curassoni]|uniref:Ovule protein n=1 Tax=Schistosoma curassoni TaxID=6186 RepID=A0A183JUD6_9TREM|nr:unnamed protein product [Schistosoma curassoni]
MMMMMTNQAKQNVITTSVDPANDQHRVSEFLPVNTAICNGNSSSNNSSSLQSITSSIPCKLYSVVI